MKNLLKTLNTDQHSITVNTIPAFNYTRASITSSSSSQLLPSL